MYLGIDIGTSAVKALVADEDQRIVASTSAPLTTQRPHPLWSEQDPDAWWTATEAAVAALRAALPDAWPAIRAVGLSGQMHGAVLVDGDGRPLRPAILHNDGRSHAEAGELNCRVADFGRIAGVPAMPGFAAPKLLWLRRHEPSVMDRARRLLLPKDYVRLRMTGSHATDMSDASGSVILDSGARAWSAEIAAACEIEMSLLPPVLESTAVAGRLSGAVAAAWGLAPGLVVAAGSGDAAAGAAASGVVDEGDAFISIGTAAQYFVARDSYRPAPAHLIHSFCHCLPGRWFQMAALLNGASCLAWAAGVLGRDDIGVLLEEAERAFRGPSPSMFLPYLAGERTPHNNPHAKGVLFGLTAATTAETITQAVLDGVVLSLADCQAYVAETGPLPERIAVSGGASKSRFWMGLLASALGRTVVLHEGSAAGPAFGATRLARMALTGEAPGEVCTKPGIAAEIAPDPGLADAYGERLQRFRALYRAVSAEFTG